MQSRVELLSGERSCRIDKRRIARNPVVVCASTERISMYGEVTSPGIEQDRAIETIVHGCRSASELQTDAALRYRVGNSIVGRIDDTADRLRTPTQGRRAAHHLDLIGRQRIDGYEMIFAEIRGAVGSHAVFLNAHAIGVEPANDRAAGCSWRKAGAGDCGLVVKNLAK